MKLLKRLLLLVAVLLLGAILLAVLGMYLAYKTPSFYTPYTWDVQQRAALNQQALDKLLRTHNLAAESQAAERRAQLGATPRPATQMLTVSLTEEEINAFLTHNAELENLNAVYERYARNPGVFLKKDQVILAAEVKEVNALVSLHFEPTLDQRGQLRLQLTSTTIGRLPIPKAILNQQLERIRTPLTSRLPQWQREATMDSTGRANTSAVAAALAKLLLGALDDEPADAVLFMPLGHHGKSVPLRLTRLQIADRSLQFTVEAMSKAQRDTLLKSIRAPLALTQPPR